MSARIEPLTAAAFARFGDVIEASEGVHSFDINQGFTRRYHDLAQVDVNNRDGRTAVNIFRSTPLPLPLKLTIMERHPLSSQAFFPLSGHPYLVVVAPAGELLESEIKIFWAAPNQGVNYHAGTWHHFSLALHTVSDFLVIDRAGPGENCDEITLTKPITIEAWEVGLD